MFLLFVGCRLMFVACWMILFVVGGWSLIAVCLLIVIECGLFPLVVFVI